MISFFPNDKEVPSKLIFDSILIRQLRSTDNELDYQAVIESGFRPEGFPKEENLKQISKHERDHNDRKEFAFTIMDVNETICYGCIFIKPINPFLKFAFFNDRVIESLDIKENDPGISFWITPKGWKLNLFERILKELKNWFKAEWSYDRLFFLGIRPSQEEIDEIEKIGLKRNFLLQIEKENYILWQLY
jgi:hypothetical protein